MRMWTAESGGQDHGIPWLRPGRGVAHVVSFFEALPVIDVKRFEPFSIVADGDRVIALINLEAVVLETGRTVNDLEVHVWTFGADGKATSMRHVVDTIAHAPAWSTEQHRSVAGRPTTRRSPGR